jgi:feruloyl esterase
VRQFYGSRQSKSYYLGCSQGGRQGVANALKFPDDFDGIIAGSPALDFNSLVSWRASFYPVTGPSNSANFIRPEVWSGLIYDEVLRQCDGIDGVMDGIIEYPDQCNFKLDPLRCTNSNSTQTNCLTNNQIEQLRHIYSPLTYGNGELIFPGMQVGSEQRAIDRLYAGKPFSDSYDWFRYVVYNSPNWDPLRFTPADAEKANELNPFDVRTWPRPRDLQSFRKQGGKLITYHGMADQQITSYNTARWFEHLHRESSFEELDEWVRFFRISGMYHCNSGPGAWNFGQVPGTAYEAENNVLAAIVKWVEEGVAPAVLEGIKPSDDPSSNASPQFSRRHCRFVFIRSN